MPYEYKARFKKIIDGDTIVLDIDLGFSVVLANQTIRLIGIDTPESKSKDKVEKIFGIASKKAVEEFIKNSDQENLIIQTIFCDENGDKFGRILGKIFNSNKVCLNDWLVEFNYAVKYDGENKDKIKNLHMLNRKKLIDNKTVNISYGEAGIVT